MRFAIASLLVTLALAAPPAALCQEPVASVQQRIQHDAASGAGWPLSGDDFDGTHYSPLHGVNRGNVEGLGLDWWVDLPSPNGIAATPIVVDGTIYLSGAFSIVFAIDASSGRTLWTFDPGVKITESNNWTGRVNRGVAVWGDRVLVTVSDCRLIGLDRATGKQVWSQLTCDPKLGYSITDAPHVGGGKVFVGNAGSEKGTPVRGFVSAYDAASGTFLWRFYTVPSPVAEENTTPEMQLAFKSWSGDALEKYGGGGNNWNEMTFDPDSGLLFFGTAGALPYVYDKRSPGGGDNLFTSSVMAVDAETGKYVWHYQTVPQDNWDYNATMNIVLAELPVGGEQRKVLMIAPKNGFFYVLDRLSGKLLSAEHYVRVNWATHIDLQTGRPVLDPKGMFWKLPPGTVFAAWPNMWGAHSTQPMAYSPAERLVYIPAVNVPDMVTWKGDGDYSDTLEAPAVVDGKPLVPGMLIAWDPVTQSQRWVVDHDVAFNGGVLATAGGLVFQGDGDGRFSAFDAGNGKRLWSASTGSAISAAPVSYLLDGRQRVLIPVGSGSGIQFEYPTFTAGPKTLGRTRLMSFSLAGKAAAPDTTWVARALPDLPELKASPQTIARGRELWESAGCVGCHGKDAVARVGGTVPDLRYSSRETYSHWNDIVIGGSLAAAGMLPRDISAEDAEAIRAYVWARARALQAQ